MELSQKLVFQEYHDPDYPSSEPVKKFEQATLTPEERAQKIRAIVKREFEREVESKEQEIIKIENRIHLARKLLHRVRYAVVSNYYNLQSLDKTQIEAEKTIGIITNNDEQIENQKIIHPALKPIIGKKPIDYEDLLKIRPTREAAKTAKNYISSELKKKKDKKILQIMEDSHKDITIIHGINDDENIIKVPRYIDPLREEKHIPKLNGARGRNQAKHLIVVGNTSKYIGNTMSMEGITHKWLVYVRTKTDTNINKIVNKVRFFLHPSYKPNDIVEVSSPPFQLSRRGWGEFPIRLQLFFHPELNQKPAQLVHNLVLDKSLSGLQTMGAETVVEMWLRSDCDLVPESSDVQIKMEKNSNVKNLDNSIHEETNSNEGGIMFSWLHNSNKNTNITNFMDEEETLSSKLPNSGGIMLNGNENSISNVLYKNNCELDKNSMHDINSTQTNHLDSEHKNINLKTKNVHNNFDSDLGNNRNNLTETVNESKSKIFKRKLFKYIDKDNNVKFLQMFVNQTKLSNSSDLKLSNPTDDGLNENESTNLQSLVKMTIPLDKIKAENEIDLDDCKNNIKSVSSSTGTNIKKIIVINNKKQENYSNLNLNILRALVKSPNKCDVNLSTKSKNVENVSQQSLSNMKLNISQNNSILLNNKSDNSIEINQKPNNQVVLKNGKMYIIDPQQAKLKKQLKYQESLLKPQISLLKPILKNDNLQNCIRNSKESNQIFNHTVIARDHDYTSLMGKSPISNTGKIYNPIPTVLQKSSNINTLKSKNCSPITVSIERIIEEKMNDVNFNKSVQMTSRGNSIMKKPRFDYKAALEMEFLEKKFTKFRFAIEFLLRKLPLVDVLASRIDYRCSFPFITSSEDIFDNFTVPKKRANEWLRAKFISKLIRRHTDLRNSKLWSTKEIILFARQHAYTPIMSYGKVVADNNSIDFSGENNLKNLIKNEIQREQCMESTLSLNHEAYEWINEMKSKINGYDNLKDEIIDIDGIETDIIKENKRKIQSFERSTEHQDDRKRWFYVDNHLENERSIVNDSIQQIGVQFHPEEIIPDVLHHSSEVVLAQAVRCFIDDLLRRSIASKFKKDSTIDSCYPPSIQSIESDDIKMAINSRIEFDFLTNRHLGIARIKGPMHEED